MTIIRSDGKKRVEVEFHVQHDPDPAVLGEYRLGLITVSEETITYPVSGRGVQWRKRQSTERELFTVAADLVPALMERLATGLTFPADGSHV